MPTYGPLSLIQTFARAKVSSSFPNAIPATRTSCNVVEIRDRCGLFYLASIKFFDSIETLIKSFSHDARRKVISVIITSDIRVIIWCDTWIMIKQKVKCSIQFLQFLRVITKGIARVIYIFMTGSTSWQEHIMYQNKLTHMRRTDCNPL